MKVLYLDIFSGISGDMFLGALLDVGVNFGEVESGLAKLGLHGYHLHASRGQKSGITGTKFDVHLAVHAHPHEHPDDADPHSLVEHDEHDHPHHPHHHAHEHGHEHDHGHDHEHEGEDHESHHHDAAGHDHDHPHTHPHDHAESRDFAQIKDLIQASSLSSWVKERSIAVFTRIAAAEGKIHGQPPEQVHFHEVGAVDSIVDIVGACLALELLGRPRVLAAPVTEGTGWVRCAHGRFPLPAPATLEILGARGIPIMQCDEPHELVTPTGAAILAELVESFGPMQNLTATRIGYGLGTRDHHTRPNVLRAVLGETAAASTAGANDWETDAIAVLETNLDDSSAEILGQFVEQGLAAGALDVFHTAIQMKKNRPGVLLTVLCRADEADRFTEQILRETSAFGVRRTLSERRKLRRAFQTVKTPFGEVTVKTGTLNGRVLQAAPEFESCRRLATQAGVPVKEIYQAAIQAL